MRKKKTSEERKVEKWLAIRKKAGLKINPKTAIVTRHAAQILDPYGDDPDLPGEFHCFGQVDFARSPGSDVWVSFYDLPSTTAKALRKKYASK
jgi:hypothetical protein